MQEPDSLKHCRHGAVLTPAANNMFGECGEMVLSMGKTERLCSWAHAIRRAAVPALAFKVAYALPSRPSCTKPIRSPRSRCFMVLPSEDASKAWDKIRNLSHTMHTRSSRLSAGLYANSATTNLSKKQPFLERSLIGSNSPTLDRFSAERGMATGTVLGREECLAGTSPQSRRSASWHLFSGQYRECSATCGDAASCMDSKSALPGLPIQGCSGAG